MKISPEKFQELRKNTSLTQKQFSEKYNIPYRTYQRWEEQGAELYKYTLLSYAIEMEAAMNVNFNFEKMLEKYGYVVDYGYTAAIECIDEVEEVLEAAKKSEDELFNEWGFYRWYDDYFEQLKDFVDKHQFTEVRFGDDPDTMDIYYTYDIKKVVDDIKEKAHLYTEDEIREKLIIIEKED